MQCKNRIQGGELFNPGRFLWAPVTNSTNTSNSSNTSVDLEYCLLGYVKKNKNIPVRNGSRYPGTLVPMVSGTKVTQTNNPSVNPLVPPLGTFVPRVLGTFVPRVLGTRVHDHISMIPYFQMSPNTLGIRVRGYPDTQRLTSWLTCRAWAHIRTYTPVH